MADQAAALWWPVPKWRSEEVDLVMVVISCDGDEIGGEDGLRMEMVMVDDGGGVVMVAVDWVVVVVI